MIEKTTKVKWKKFQNVICPLNAPWPYLFSIASEMIRISGTVFDVRIWLISYFNGMVIF